MFCPSPKLFRAVGVRSMGFCTDGSWIGGFGLVWGLGCAWLVSSCGKLGMCLFEFSTSTSHIFLQHSSTRTELLHRASRKESDDLRVQIT